MLSRLIRGFLSLGTVPAEQWDPEIARKAVELSRRFPQRVDCSQSVSRITSTLLLTRHEKAEDVETLLSNNVRVVIRIMDVAPSLEYVELLKRYGIKLHHFWIQDVEHANFGRVFDQLGKPGSGLVHELMQGLHRDSGEMLLIHCHAGVSRSATAVLWILTMFYNISLDRAIEHLVAVRPCVRPNVGFLCALLTHIPREKWGEGL